MRSHFFNGEILHALTADDEIVGRTPALRTIERRVPLRVSNSARTSRTPEFVSLTGLEVAAPEPEVARLPKLSVFLDRCRALGLIGQSIALLGGLVTTDVLADFYEATYQGDPALVIDRTRQAGVTQAEREEIASLLPVLASHRTAQGDRGVRLDAPELD